MLLRNVSNWLGPRVPNEVCGGIHLECSTGDSGQQEDHIWSKSTKISLGLAPSPGPT
jgi:hypothetical protein